MMKRYQNEQRRTESKGTTIALVLTLLFHAGLVISGYFNGLVYMSPPPPEQSFLVDFSEDVEEKPVIKQQRHGSAPQAENPDRTKPIALAQRSEAQEIGTKDNKAKEATVDDYGDVEKYEPKREKPINERALFHAADNKSDKDTLAPQTATNISEKLKTGHAQGNTKIGKTNVTPNAHVKGRNTLGVIARPSYPVQESGIVVVNIWVDNYGNVKKAQSGGTGTTVNNAALWAAAREAALNTHFNVDADAPALQAGTITYKFELKGK